MKKIHKYITEYRLLNPKDRQLVKFENQIKSEYQFNIKINQKQKMQIYNQIVGVKTSGRLNNFFFRFKYAIAVVAVLVFSLTSLVVLAQKSQPGDNLYSIKKASQRIRLWLQPGYIKSIVKDHQLETEKLIKENAPESDVVKAKREYSDSVIKAIDSDYSEQIKQDINGSIIENITNSNTENHNNRNEVNGSNPVENSFQPTPTNGQRNQNNRLN